MHEKMADRVNPCLYRGLYMASPLDVIIRYHYGQRRIV